MQCGSPPKPPWSRGATHTDTYVHANTHRQVACASSNTLTLPCPALADPLPRQEEQDWAVWAAVVPVCPPAWLTMPRCLTAGVHPTSLPSASACSSAISLKGGLWGTTGAIKKGSQNTSSPRKPFSLRLSLQSRDMDYLTFQGPF